MARFLVVDDDHATVRALTKLLARDGHQVSPSYSGAEAIDALSRDPFDVVVTDLEMPQLDGLAVMRAARDRAPHACLVVATARALDKAQVLADASACVIVDKPFDYENLAKVLTACLSQGGRAETGGCPMRSGQAPLLVKVRT
jgi:DNA-binding NtrC family response regulator